MIMDLDTIMDYMFTAQNVCLTRSIDTFITTESLRKSERERGQDCTQTGIYIGRVSRDEYKLHNVKRNYAN